MDKYEYRLKLDEIKETVSNGEYAEAARLADSVNWNKVRNANTLCLIGSVYKKVSRTEDAREIYRLAYKRSPGSKNALYYLCELSIKLGEADVAQNYYNEFEEIAPRDQMRFVLGYKLACLKDKPIQDRIELLEELKRREFIEEWAYELAYLYYQADQAERCIKACDELAVWFGDGEYVRKALELKTHFQPLSPSQQEQYGRITHADEDSSRREAQVERIVHEELAKEVRKETQRIEDETRFVPVEKPQAAADESSAEAPVVRTDEEPEEKPYKEVPYREVPFNPAFLNKQEEKEEEPAVEEAAEEAEAAVEEAAAEEAVVKETAAEEAAVKEAAAEEAAVKEAAAEEAAIEEAAAEEAAVKETAVEEAAAEAAAVEETATEERSADPILTGLENIRDGAAVLLGSIEASDSKTAYKEAVSEIRDIVNALEEAVLVSADASAEEPAADGGAAAEEPAAAEEGAAEEPAADGETAAEEPAAEEPAAGEDTAAEQETKEIPAGEPAAEIPHEDAAEEQEEFLDDEDGEPVQPAVQIGKETFRVERAAEDVKAAEASGADLSDFGEDDFSGFDEDSFGEQIDANLEESLEAALAEAAGEFGLDDDKEEFSAEVPSDKDFPDQTLSDTGSSNQALLKEESSEPDLSDAGSSNGAPSDEEFLDDDSDEEDADESEDDMLDDDEEMFDNDEEEDAAASVPDADDLLNEEQRAYFSYFIPVPGMEAQICDAIEGICNKTRGARTSETGNAVIIGEEGSGKTVLATSLIKVVQDKLDKRNAKIGKISAVSLNRRDFAGLIPKIAGGYLIVEDAGELTRETAIRMSQIMEQNTEGLLIILEDNAAGIRRALDLDYGFGKKFTQKVRIPIFTIDELVTFGKSYAAEKNCVIDEMGVLALYNRINNIQKLDHVTTLTEVKQIMDDAIDSARNGSKKVFGSIFSKRGDDEDMLTLQEADFDV